MWDFDAIVAACTVGLSSRNRDEWPADLVWGVGAMRYGLVEWVKTQKDLTVSVFVIAENKLLARRVAETIGAELVELET